MEIIQHVKDPTYTIKLSQDELSVIDDILLQYFMQNRGSFSLKLLDAITEFRNQAAPYLRYKPTL